MTAAVAKTRVVLVLCGSFSPVTNCHLRLFELARDCLQKSGKCVVESGILSPVHDAYGKKGLVACHHRVAMCRLATKSSDWIKVDPWETEQEEWTVSYKVLQHFQKQVSQTRGMEDARVKLLCGADLLESFATPDLWSDEDIKGIIGEFGLVVSSRSGHNADKFVYESDKLFPLKSNIQICTDWIPNDISSTKIRRGLKRGESVRYLVPDDIIAYIKEHHLYQE